MPHGNFVVSLPATQYNFFYVLVVFKYTSIIFLGCSLRIITVMTNGVLERHIHLSELQSLVRKHARLTVFVYGKKSLSNI